MSVERSKVIRISRQPFSAEIIVDRKLRKNVEYFACLGSM
jgi:hypothetical protein